MSKSQWGKSAMIGVYQPWWWVKDDVIPAWQEILIKLNFDELISSCLEYPNRCVYLYGDLQETKRVFKSNAKILLNEYTKSFFSTISESKLKRLYLKSLIREYYYDYKYKYREIALELGVSYPTVIKEVRKYVDCEKVC